MQHWWDEVSLSLREGVRPEQLPALLHPMAGPGMGSTSAFTEPGQTGKVGVQLGLLEGLGGVGRPLSLLLHGRSPEEEALGLAYLAQLDGLGLLAFGVVAGAQCQASLQPMVQGPLGLLRPIEEKQPFRLSRFAFLRRLGSWSVLESPRVPALLRLDEPSVAALLLRLHAPCTFERWPTEAASSLRLETLAALFGLLVTSGFLVACDEHGTTEEETEQKLATWSFHELLFHRRSRPGPHAFPVGKTYPFRGIFEPLPALHPPHARVLRRVPLEKPTHDEGVEASLFQVLRQRRSERVPGPHPLPFSALSRLLFHALRVEELMPRSPLSVYEYTRRPYPSGGAAYDLEVYLIVGSCEQLETGLYHYDPAEHALSQLTGETSELVQLRLEAASNSPAGVVPQLLVALASRFQRLSWSYENMAYATTLKNAGVVYQTLYLVATALGLACCGMGRGSSTLFAQAAGLDPLEEGTVGELIIGSRGEST